MKVDEAFRTDELVQLLMELRRLKKRVEELLGG